MLILLTNDDGIDSSGLEALAERLREIGRVIVSAPSRGRSATSHAITLHAPLLVRSFRRGGILHYAVDGTPVDCVKLSLRRLLPSCPDIVVSGINEGLNTGPNVFYSGTVAGAMEGGMNGIPSFAISMQMDAKPDFGGAAALTLPLIESLARRGPPLVFNINVPALNGRGVRGVRICAQERGPSVDRYDRTRDGRGRTCYRLRPDDSQGRRAGSLSDASAVSQGYIAVSPLQSNLTRHEAISDVERLIRATAVGRAVLPKSPPRDPGRSATRERRSGPSGE